MVFEDFEEGEEYKTKDICLEIGYIPHATMPRGIVPGPKEEHSAVMIRLNLEKNLYADEFDDSSSVLLYWRGSTRNRSSGA